jgi:hypothetical protein
MLLGLLCGGGVFALLLSGSRLLAYFLLVFVEGGRRWVGEIGRALLLRVLLGGGFGSLGVASVAGFALRCAGGGFGVYGICLTLFTALYVLRVVLWAGFLLLIAAITPLLLSCLVFLTIPTHPLHLPHPLPLNLLPLPLLLLLSLCHFRVLIRRYLV